MRLLRLSTVTSFGLAFASGLVLFWTSQNVQQSEIHERQLKQSIVDERESIRVLRAEWDYLNRPDRLEAMAGRYLDMKAPAPVQLLEKVADIPDVPAEAAPEIESAPKPSLKSAPAPVQAIEAALIPPKPVKPDAAPQQTTAETSRSFQALLESLEQQKDAP